MTAEVVGIGVSVVTKIKSCKYLIIVILEMRNAGGRRIVVSETRDVG